MTTLQSKEEFKDFVAEIEAQDGYQRPLAFGIGIATLDDEQNMLDTWFPYPNYRAHDGTAAAFAHAVEKAESPAPGVYIADEEVFRSLKDSFAPFENDGGEHHNIRAIEAVERFHLANQSAVIVFIPEDDPGPQSVPDAYLRLHLLSHRLVKPNGIKLDGTFGILPNVAWTSEGPIATRELPERQLVARLLGNPLVVHSVDKFPRMTDYVVPSGVRIGDASRVRLGAHLGEGTTVMHEGFVNFNAGTLGKSMVEGRISAGVVVGDGSDLGGSASIMGTLSGGGKEVISVGERCLIGANAGIGISLGDDCLVEAGCYVTAGSKVSYFAPENHVPATVKALELSSRNGLLFRRNSLTGALEALPNEKAIALNEQLHSKQ